MLRFRFLTLALGAAMFGAVIFGACGFSTAARAQSIRIASPNGINLFSESERPALQLNADGAAPAFVNYSIREVEGGFSRAGVLMWRPGENRLPLDVPHRGLYDLTLRPQNGTELQTRFGIVFEPPAVSQNSRWGMFSIRFDNAARDREMARGHRLVGASWSRFNLWADAWQNIEISQGETPTVSFDLNPGYLSAARALTREGLHLMGEFSMMPRALSSKPDDVGSTIEGAPGWSRVRPKNYKLWNQLVEQTVRALPQVEVWEVWNEPDARNFWIDTPQAFAEFCRQTAGAIKRANPRARVAVAGVTSNGGAFLETLLQNGVDETTDIWSFHAPPAPMRAILKKHDVSPRKPLWETETHALLDFDVIGGYDRTFHFLYRAFVPAYETFPALVDRDGLPTSAALTYATAVHVLGESKLEKHVAQNTMELGVFRKGKEAVAAWKTNGSGLLSGLATFKIAPLANRALELLDGFGRARKIPAKNADGTLTFAIQGASFLSGAASLDLVRFQAPENLRGSRNGFSTRPKARRKAGKFCSRAKASTRKTSRAMRRCF